MVQSPKSFMVIAAHPDDIEMSCGGTVAKFIAEGAQGHYLLITDGEKGGRRCQLTEAELANKREEEQREAAREIGVSAVEFLKQPDAGVVYSSELRSRIVRWIRQWKPDLVLTHDPRTLVLDWGEINHVDHRAVGSVALDAIFPFARGRLFHEDMIAEGLAPHAVKDVLLWDSQTPNCFIDIENFVEARIKSVEHHRSQFPKIEPVAKWIREYAAKTAKDTGLKYAEAFQHIDLRPVF